MLKQQDFFLEYKSYIENNLSSLLQKDSSLDDFRLSSIQEAIHYSVIGAGKRIRAILSLITAEAILNEKKYLAPNPAIGLALALELIHAGSLIHDDLPCMDDDDMRRGKASNHIKFGEATALLAGDSLLTYPLKVLLTQTPTNYQCNIHTVLIELIDAINAMIAGQALDLTSSKSTGSFSDLEQIHKLKTGAILRTSVRSAAILANASPEQVTALSLFAEKIGLAFQIVDDILDQTTDSQTLGKTAGKDQAQNKLTYLSFYSIDEARELSTELIKQAKKNIQQIDIYTDKLNLVADYVISRAN